MIENKYNASFKIEEINQSIRRLINQTYKLLPNREEGNDWEKPLETITEELAGMDIVLIGKHNILFPLLCKLEGLVLLKEEKDFQLFRRTIFECLSLMHDLEEQCQD